MYPPTPDRRQSKTFLTIDERHRRQRIWTPPPLLKIHKNMGFPKQYWSGFPENHKATDVQSQHLMLVHVAFRWRSLVARLLWYFDPLFSPHQLIKSCQSWTPLDPRMNADQKSLETVFSTAIVWRQIAI